MSLDIIDSTLFGEAADKKKLYRSAMSMALKDMFKRVFDSDSRILEVAWRAEDESGQMGLVDVYLVTKVDGHNTVVEFSTEDAPAELMEVRDALGELLCYSHIRPDDVQAVVPDDDHGNTELSRSEVEKW